MRCFLAVVPPEDVAADLSDFLAPRRDAAPDWRWSRPPTWHLTLAFLPDLAEHLVEPLVAELEHWAIGRAPLSLRWGGAGAFPAPERARVLWIGVVEPEANEQLARFSRAHRSIAAHLGTVVDGQRFVPHLTVARSGRAQSAGRLVQALDTYRSPAARIGEVSLIASHAGQPGRRGGTPARRYETLATVPLG